MGFFDNLKSFVKKESHSFFDNLPHIIQGVTNPIATAAQDIGQNKAAQNLAIDTARSPFRAAVSLGVPGLAKQNQDPSTYDIIQKTVLGNTPVPSATQANRIPGLPSALAAPISVGLTAANLTPLGSGKEGILKSLAQSGSTTGVTKVLQELKGLKLGDNAIREVAPKIAQSTDPAEIDSILRTAMKASPTQKAISTIQGVPGPEQAAQTPVDKLIGAIKEGKQLQPKLAAAQTQGRAIQAAKAQKALETGTGREAFVGARKAASGTIAERPSLTEGILTPEETNSLYDTIKNHPTLRTFEKLQTADALDKVTRGELPQPSQLANLEDVFGSDLVKEIVKTAPPGSWVSKIRGGADEVVSSMRALKTTADASAVLRQTLLATVAHPVKATKAFASAFKETFSDSAFRGWLNDIQTKTPDEWNRAKDAGLYIGDPEKVMGGRNAREEAFRGQLLEKIPILGSVIRGSERNFYSYSNHLRWGLFNDVADRFEQSGIADPGTLKALGNFVNDATGRGRLGKLEVAAPELSQIFFAPRNTIAKINSAVTPFNPNVPAPVRKQAAADLVKLVGAGTAVLALAKLGGAEVQADPRSADFGKIKVGNTRWDIWGGYQQLARNITQIASGKSINATTGKVQDANRLDTAVRFARSKLAPVPGSIVDIGQGSNVVGQTTTPGSVVSNQISPLLYADLINAVQDQGPNAILTAGVPGFLGVGVQSYDASKTGAKTKARKASNPLLNTRSSRAATNSLLNK